MTDCYMNNICPGDYTSGHSWDDDAHHYLMTDVIDKQIIEEIREEEILREIAAEEEKNAKYEIHRR